MSTRPTTPDPSAVPSWSTLVATALVGTRRRPDPVPGVPGDPADALLDAAALRWTGARAGVLPLRVAGVVAAAPAETLPVIPAAGWNRLAAVTDRDNAVDLAGDRSELLAELLRAIVDAGRRVPAELLPGLLDAARRYPELRPLVLAAGGARAGWLAAQRADWQPLTAVPDSGAEDDRDAWEHGSPGRRAGYLAGLRRRDPDQARELLTSVWPNEAPADRAALLATFDTGLCTADEALLEQALDDRRKEVRAVAADLLPRLPDAAYARRMVARARACVTRTEPARGLSALRTLGRDQGRLRVTPPMSCDAAMRRDGVVAKPPAGLGERAWWLMEVLARTPLSSWTADTPDGPALAATPERFLALRVEDDWAGPLHRGLARAAVLQGDRAWAGPLLDALLPAGAPARRSDDLSLLLALYELLPPQEQVPIAVRALEQSGNQPYEAHPFLVHCPTPWPQPLADAFFTALRRLLNRRGDDWTIGQLCQLAAVRLSPAAADRAAQLAEAARDRYPGSAAERGLNSLTDTLRFRTDMLKELA